MVGGIKMKSTKYEQFDVHHHIVPDFYVNELEKLGITKVSGLSFPKWTIEKSQKMMKKYNIKKAFLSISTPGVWFKDRYYSRNLARRCNEYIAQIKKDFPNQFGGYASLPLPDVEGSIEELKYALDVLDLDGVCLMSNVEGHYLGDKAYRPLFEELNKRNAVVFIHVNTPPEKENLELLNCFYWWFIDTTKTLLEIIKSGYHRDFPNIKYIPAHGGGVLPAIYPKLIEVMKEHNQNIEDELMKFKEQLYLDTAKSVSDEALPSLLNFSDINHVVFGSDFIWANQNNISYWVNQINSLDLSSEYTKKIYKDNARNLFEGNVDESNTQISYPKLDLYNNSNTKYHYHCIPDDVVKVIEELNLPVNKEVVWNKSKIMKLIEDKNYQNIMLSFDMPEVWVLENKDIRTILRTFNTSISRVVNKDKQKLGAFGAIDSQQVEHAIEEIDYCLNDLKLSGLCIYINISNTSVVNTIDPKLLNKLATVNVPIMIHPKFHDGIPIDNESYLDSAYFMAKIFYSNEIMKLEDTKLILTHTGGLIEFLADNIGILYYLQHEKWRMVKYLYDYLVKKKQKGKEILRNVIIDD